MYDNHNNSTSRSTNISNTLHRCKSHREYLRAQNLDNDENSLDLFSNNFRTPSNASSDGSQKLGKHITLETLKVRRRGIDDLFSLVEGKHDYDWLLTPPGSPLVPLLSEEDFQKRSAASKNSTLVISTSTIKSSKLSLSQSESNYFSRGRRSSSATCTSISTSHHSSYSSSGLYLSCTRQSSPVTRTTSAAKNVASSARSQSSSFTCTPSRSRPTSSTDQTRSPQTSRSSTPISRAQNCVNLSSLAARFKSRTSSPTRKRAAGCHSAPSSRPSSPVVQPHQQHVIPPDFPFDTPPNLKTSMPNRPLSVGRYRPGPTLGLKGNSDVPGPMNIPKRLPSPIFRRGRVAEPLGRCHKHDSGHTLDASELSKTTDASELAVRKTIATESIGLGRKLSKISLDMAKRQMDIKSVTGSSRLLSGATIFPQSIRSSSAITGSTQVPIASIGAYDKNEFTSDAEKHTKRYSGNKSITDDEHFGAKLSEEDSHWNSSIFQEEDLKNTSWLHSVDGDEEPIFDNEIEPLPEPFDHLSS